MYFHRRRVLLYFGAPLLSLQVFVLIVCVFGAVQHVVDFRTYYAGGQIIRAGNGAHLYSYETQRVAQGPIGGVDILNMRYMAPPFAALLFVPLTWFGFVPAYLVFLALNLLQIVITARLVAPYLPMVQARAGPVWLLFLTFFPVEMALGQGQPTIIVLALLCFAYVSLQLGRSLIAGMLLSLALIKFQIVLPVVLLFLLWRQWAVIGGFLLGSIPLGILSLLAMQLNRPARIMPFLAALPHTVPVVFAELGRGTHPGSMPNLYGLLYLLGAHTAGLLLSLILSLLLLLWASRQRVSLPLALLVATLVSSHLYVHDLTPAILPLALLLEQILVVGRWPFLPASSASDWRFIVCVGPLAILLAAPLVLVLMGNGLLPLLTIPLGIITFLFPGMSSPQLSAASPAATRQVSNEREELTAFHRTHVAV